ncbi:MAG: alpha/beta hydrolase [archaeon]|nr:alpha/beta hydrolase [archaeon]
MFLSKKKVEVPKEEKLPSYQSTQNDMRFGKYKDLVFQETLSSPVNDKSLQKAFQSIEKNISDFLPSFLNLIKEDTLKINELSLDLGKKTIKYWISASELRNLIYAIHKRFFPSEDELGKYNNIDKIVENYMEELKEVKGEIKLQYRDDCKSKIKKEILPFFDKIQTVLDSREKSGQIIMQNTLNFCANRINDIQNKMNSFSGIPVYVTKDSDRNKKNQIIFLDFLISLEKINIMSMALFKSFLTPEDDLFNLPEKDDSWKNLSEKYERISFEEKDLKEIEKAEKDTEKYFKTMTVLSDNCFDTDSEAMKAWNLTKFGVVKDKSDLGMEIEFRKSLLNEDLGKALKGITRLIKNGAVKMGIRPNLPSLEFKKKLYLKKLYKDITRDLIYDILDTVNRNKLYSLEDINREEKKKEKEEKMEVPQDIYLGTVKKEFKPYFVSTRMLCSSNVKFPSDGPGLLTTVFRRMEEPVMYRDALIIHIHSGAFVGMSTFACEYFLRQWTNKLGVPILGIDYCLSPKNKYPSALNDCWQAYHWILNNAEKEWAIKPRRIILTGDAAGGNLALALTYLLIATKQRIPDFLLLINPACEINSKEMTSSLLKSFDDNYVSPASLLYAKDAYVGDYFKEDDIFLNQWKAKDIILKNMPKTRFFLADYDPLRDGALKTAAEIANKECDFKVFDFEGLMHGFLKEKAPVLSGVPNKIIMEELEEYLNETEAPVEDIQYVKKERKYPKEFIEALKREEEEKKRKIDEQRRLDEENERKAEEEEIKRKADNKYLSRIILDLFLILF